MKEYVDLGLPSGTLWSNINESGYYNLNKINSSFYDINFKVEDLPTKEQFRELISNCTFECSRGGYKVIGKNGRSIFLPALGKISTDGIRCNPLDGFYLSSTLNGCMVETLRFSIDFKPYIYDEFAGELFSVRLVKKKNVN